MEQLTGHYPERICLDCGRFVVVDYVNKVVIHIIGPLYDPWKRKLVQSSYIMNEDAKTESTQTANIVNTGGVTCKVNRSFWSLEDFEIFLAGVTQCCHVNAEFNFLLPYLVIDALRTIVNVIFINDGNDTLREWCHIAEGYNLNAQNVVLMTESAAPLRAAFAGLNELWGNKTILIPNWMYYNCVALSNCNYVLNRQWRIMGISPVADLWSKLRDFVRKKGFCVPTHKIHVQDCVRTFIFYMSYFRLRCEFDIMYDLNCVDDLGRILPHPSLSINEGVESVWKMYCEYFDCPFCEPGSADNEYAAEMRKQCCSKGTLISQ